MKRLIPILMLCAVVASGCYDRHSEPRQELPYVVANCSIGELRGLCEGAKYHTIDEEKVCVGRITSSDREGNFYRTIVVEDESGGVEVKVGEYGLASQYPLGSQVALYLNGTALAIVGGVVQMGLPPQSFDTSLRELESPVLIDKHIVRCCSAEAIEARLCDIPSLDMTLCGSLLRIEGIHLAPLEEEGRDVSLKEYHRFADGEGNAIFIYISSYADFTDLDISVCKGIEGILYHESVGEGIGTQFVIKPRFRDDFATISDTF